MPLLTPARVARGLGRRVQMLRHTGHGVYCPVCSHHFDRFRDDWNRPNAICWRCGAHERHRALWLLLDRRSELISTARSLLHFSPEWSLQRRLKQASHLRYVTADLDRSDVDLQLDLTALDLPDACFDAVVCSHVLEHVQNDADAMRELRRITAAGGWCLVMVPIDLGRDQTYEDPAIVSPQQRESAFWQHDHVRLYAPDIGDRLMEVGFRVERIRPFEEFGLTIARRCRLLEADDIWLCRPAA